VEMLVSGQRGERTRGSYEVEMLWKGGDGGGGSGGSGRGSHIVKMLGQVVGEGAIVAILEMVGDSHTRGSYIVEMLVKIGDRYQRKLHSGNTGEG
jgi:hypothetical protein